MLASGMLWHEKSLRILESKYLYAENDFIYIKQNDAEINKLVRTNFIHSQVENCCINT